MTIISPTGVTIAIAALFVAVAVWLKRNRRTALGESIDDRDPAYLFGQVITRLDNHDRIVQLLVEKQGDTRQALVLIERTVALLPCQETLNKLKDLAEQLNTQDKEKKDEKKERVKQKISFQQGVVLILISSVIATTLTLITNGLAAAMGG